MRELGYREGKTSRLWLVVLSIGIPLIMLRCPVVMTLGH
jgi:hypothetical protein